MPDGNNALNAAARAPLERVSSPALMPRFPASLDGMRKRQWTARHNFAVVANKLRYGNYDPIGIFYWLEWLRAYRTEHKGYTREIVERLT